MTRTVQEMIDKAAARGGRYHPDAEDVGRLKEHVRRNPPDDPVTARIEEVFPVVYTEAVDETAELWLTSHSQWHAWRAARDAERQAARDTTPDTAPDGDGADGNGADGPPALPIGLTRSGMTVGEALDIAYRVHDARRKRRLRIFLALVEVALMLLGIYGLLDLLDVIPET